MLRTQGEPPDPNRSTSPNPPPPPQVGADPLVGRSLEGYKFLGLLGRGGFGAVYLAQHPRLDRQVAVKYIHLKNPDEYENAEHEIKILTNLRHPNVVQIYDAFRYNDYQLIMMEFITGGSLEDHIEKLGKLDLPTALDAMIQVADSLAYVHGQGILHLDLKPANILLDPQAERTIPRFVLTDFGIARFVQPDKNVSMLGGTPMYMAPEQFGFGDEAPDRRADIYQFGIILFELVVGTLPFESENLVGYATKHAYEAPPLPSRQVNGLPIALDDIILKALAKSPADRFQSAGEISRALNNLKMTLSGRGTGNLTVRLAQQVAEQAAQMQATNLIRDTEVMERTRREAVPRFSLVIVPPNGGQMTVSFNKPSVVLGRGQDTDLQLDHRTISRRHLQIDAADDGSLTVTDLGSTHGTFIDNRPLLPNQPTTWRPDQRLLIEGYILQIAAAGVPTSAPEVDTTIQKEEVKQILDRLQAKEKRPRVSMTASPEIVYVEMGRPQYIQVRFRPEDTPTAHYELRVSPGPGIDARWYTVSAGKTVEAGQTGTFEVAIAAPGIDVLGGNKYELVLEIVANNPAIPSVVQVVKVSVVPFMRFNLALQPGEVSHRRRRRAGLIITNSGNYAETFYIRAQAPDRLVIRPRMPKVQINPSQYKVVPLIFKPTRDAFREGQLVFSMIVNTQAGMTERVNGSYILPRRRRIPWLLLLVLALVLAVLINWFVFNQPPEQQWAQFVEQFNRLRLSIAEFLGLAR